jgi:hypothetical protein
MAGSGCAPLQLHGLQSNPQGWSRTYRWTDDANGNGRWDPGEEGALISSAGGSASTRLDPDTSNTRVEQATAYVERELARDFAVRTGVVFNAKRDTYGTININRPLSAYSQPLTVVDPGPDGLTGSADDGATLTAFNLADGSLGLTPVNVTTTLPDSDSDYYTWEVTRRSGKVTAGRCSRAHRDVVTRAAPERATTLRRTRS